MEAAVHTKAVGCQGTLLPGSSIRPGLHIYIYLEKTLICYSSSQQPSSRPTVPQSLAPPGLPSLRACPRPQLPFVRASEGPEVALL